MTSAYLQQKHKIMKIAAEWQDKARGENAQESNFPIHMINYCTAGQIQAEMGGGF